MRAFFCLSVCFAAAVAGAAGTSFPARIVVPGMAGGSATQQALLLAEALQGQTGQPFVVDHRSGMGVESAAAVVARSAADGLVVLFADASLAVHAAQLHLAEGLVLRELLPVGQVSATPLVLALHPRVPARTLPELLALARNRDVPLQAGAGTAGGLDHLAAALLLPPAVAAWIRPYRGEGPAVRALAEGHIDLLFVAAPLALPQWTAGRLRLLATTVPSRHAALARLPVVGSGTSDSVTMQWYALLMPPATRPGSVSIMQRAMRRSLGESALASYFEIHGVEAIGGDSAALGVLLQRETERYAALIRRSSMVP